jgi:hypothetical protein
VLAAHEPASQPKHTVLWFGTSTSNSGGTQASSSLRPVRNGTPLGEVHRQIEASGIGHCLTRQPAGK